MGEMGGAGEMPNGTNDTQDCVSYAMVIHAHTPKSSQHERLCLLCECLCEYVVRATCACNAGVPSFRWLGAVNCAHAVICHIVIVIYVGFIVRCRRETLDRLS